MAADLQPSVRITGDAYQPSVPNQSSSGKGRGWLGSGGVMADGGGELWPRRTRGKVLRTCGGDGGEDAG